MARKRFSPEQILTMLKEADVFLKQGALGMGRLHRLVTAVS